MGGEATAPAAETGRWRSIPDRFAANARRMPDRIAVETEQAALSYAEFAGRSAVLAGRLERRLPADNRLVAICLDRDVDLPVWMMSVLQVGGAYLPLDPTQPAARLAQVLEDAAPALIVANRAHLAALPPTSIPILIAEEDEHEPHGSPPLAPSEVCPDTLAYVIYTSGSTGRPKGVEIEHRSLVALMETMAASPGLAEGQKMLGMTRISFDLSVPDLFLPLFVGGTLALIGLDVAADPARLAAAFKRFRPDFAEATPSTWRTLLEWGWQGQDGLRLLAGGETMTRDLADRLLPRCGELWNIYGPTETTVWSTTCRVQRGSGPVPIGWPMTGVEVHIADKSLRLVPDGAVGEIVIGGVGVARGYRNRPELTAERFVRLENGSRVYRTGDLGRFDERGALFCLGRSDDQVKLRGFRIELGDVEAALAADPQVAWCAARLWTDPAGEPILVGYFVPRPGAAPLPGAIKAALSERIPPYMIPDRIVSVPMMPLTPNGKVDRAALPSPFAAASASTPGDSTIAARLAVIWRDLLGLSAVRPTDDFFDLGGYSLMTVRLARRIHAEFGVKLALADLLRFPTLEAMARRIVEGDVARDEAAMLLNDGGESAPLYWLDAGPLMRTMARALPAGQPMLALALSSEDETALDAQDPLRIEDVATRLRHRLIETDPVGPYRIGGWCRWGVVAFELAQQLRHEGRKVALLILLDTDRPDLPNGKGFGVRTRLARLFGSSAASVKEAVSLSQRVEQAASAYRPDAYADNILLVRPAAALGEGGWGTLLGPAVTVALTSGDHESMVRHPHVIETAAAIARGLSAARAEDRLDVHVG